MFREMRRSRQALSQEEFDEILKTGTNGVLALAGSDGYPYAVPLSYVYDEDAIYFHCAKEGHKIDAILSNPKASFCVVAEDMIVPEKFTTVFVSAIAFGTMEILEDTKEKEQALKRLAMKYSPAVPKEKHQEEIDSAIDRVCVLKMNIDRMSGKEGIERARERAKQKQN